MGGESAPSLRKTCSHWYTTYKNKKQRCQKIQCNIFSMKKAEKPENRIKWISQQTQELFKKKKKKKKLFRKLIKTLENSCEGVRFLVMLQTETW